MLLFKYILNVNLQIESIYSLGSKPESIKTVSVTKQDGGFGIYSVQSILVYRNINATITLETGEKILVDANGMQPLNTATRMTRGFFDDIIDLGEDVFVDPIIGFGKGAAETGENVGQAYVDIGKDVVDIGKDIGKGVGNAATALLGGVNTVVSTVEYAVNSVKLKNFVSKLKSTAESCVRYPSPKNDACANLLSCGLVKRAVLEKCFETECDSENDAGRVGVQVLYNTIDRCAGGSVPDCNQLVSCMLWFLPAPIAVVVNSQLAPGS